MQSSSVKKRNCTPAWYRKLLWLLLSEVIAEASQQALKLRWPEGDLLGHRDVDASADEEIKRIVTRDLLCVAVQPWS
jgi:hypothetical protein